MLISRVSKRAKKKRERKNEKESCLLISCVTMSSGMDCSQTCNFSHGGLIPSAAYSWFYLLQPLIFTCTKLYLWTYQRIKWYTWQNTIVFPLFIFWESHKFSHQSVTISQIDSHVNKQTSIPHYWFWKFKSLKRDSEPESWIKQWPNKILSCLKNVNIGKWGECSSSVRGSWQRNSCSLINLGSRSP